MAPEEGEPPALPRDAGGLLGGGQHSDAFERWAADARAAEAAAARGRERWLRQQAHEEATFAGVLLDLAEQDATVVVHTSSGRRHRGRLDTVGADFCSIQLGGGRRVLVAYAALVSVRPEPGTRPVTGDREVAPTVRFAAALADLVREEPRLVVTMLGERDPVAGRLAAVGRDLVTLLLDGDGGMAVFVPIAAIADLLQP